MGVKLLDHQIGMGGIDEYQVEELLVHDVSLSVDIEVRPRVIGVVGYQMGDGLPIDHSLCLH